MKKILCLSLILAVCTMLIPSGAQAASSPWTEKATYKEKAIWKLDFGMKNVLAGWTEIFTEPYDYYKEDKNVFAGIGIGLYHGIADTVCGALHVATFPIVQIDVPLPGGGVDFE